MSAARPQSGGGRNRQMLMLAIALLVIAGGIFVAFMRNSDDPEAEARARAVSNPEAQIKAIQDNPNMPEAAKQMAIGQLKAHANTNYQSTGH